MRHAIAEIVASGNSLLIQTIDPYAKGLRKRNRSVVMSLQMNVVLSANPDHIVQAHLAGHAFHFHLQLIANIHDVREFLISGGTDQNLSTHVYDSIRPVKFI